MRLGALHTPWLILLLQALREGVLFPYLLTASHFLPEIKCLMLVRSLAMLLGTIGLWVVQRITARHLVLFNLEEVSSANGQHTHYTCVLRVIPITIIFYRYIMVCHGEYCLVKGEQKIRKLLLKVCLGIPALVASLSMLFLDNLRGALICNGRNSKGRGGQQCP
jgi:hypothetical protein